MQITLNLDGALVQDAMSLNPDLTLERAIESVLTFYVKQQQRLKIIELLGAIDYDSDYSSRT